MSEENAEITPDTGEALGGQELAPVAPADVVHSDRNHIRDFMASGPDFDVSILDSAIEDAGRVDLKVKRDLLVGQVDSLSDDKRRKGIAAIRERFEKTRVIDTRALNDVVNGDLDDLDTKIVRNKIRQTIKSLPDK